MTSPVTDGVAGGPVRLQDATFYDQAAIEALTLSTSRAQRSGCRISWINGPPPLADHRS